MPTAWLKVSLMKSSELWYHRLKVRRVQYGIGGDSTVGDSRNEDLAMAGKVLFRASVRRDVVGVVRCGTMEAGGSRRVT